MIVALERLSAWIYRRCLMIRVLQSRRLCEVISGLSIETYQTHDIIQQKPRCNWQRAGDIRISGRVFDNLIRYGKNKHLGTQKCRQEWYRFSGTLTTWRRGPEPKTFAASFNRFHRRCTNTLLSIAISWQRRVYMLSFVMARSLPSRRSSLFMMIEA